MLKLLFVTSLVNYCFGANILFVSLLASPSHYIWNEVLVDGLLRNGHNITMLAYFRAGIKSSNYTVVHIDFDEFLAEMSDFMDDEMKQSSLRGIVSIWTFGSEVCNFCYKSKVFQMVMNYPQNSFDLIIFDVTFAHCFFPLIDHFGAPPVIGVTAFGMQPYINDIIGHRTENYIPFYSLPYTDEMTFFQRFYNVIHQKLDSLCKWYFMYEITETSRKFFGKAVPNLAEYEKNISLIFSNDDPVFDYPKTFPPNVIPIGGVHVKEPKKLDDDIQKIMDGAKGGVIFVSMGSNYNSEHYREDAKIAFVEAFSRLNLTVLWKFDGVDVSKNVIMRKWFSQTDILAHPNTKLFITHCGGLSSQESIIRGVPIVGVPLFMDQHNKCAKFKSVKGGVILNYVDLTADILYDAIQEVLSNPIYNQNMLKLSTLYGGQPEEPLKKFLVWTEYVLKNGHLDHLSVASKNMRWYQVDNWDIFAFVTVSFGVTLIALKKLCGCVRRVCTTTSKKLKKH